MQRSYPFVVLVISGASLVILTALPAWAERIISRYGHSNPVTGIQLAFASNHDVIWKGNKRFSRGPKRNPDPWVLFAEPYYTESVNDFIRDSTTDRDISYRSFRETGMFAGLSYRFNPKLALGVTVGHHDGRAIFNKFRGEQLTEKWDIGIFGQYQLNRSKGNNRSIRGHLTIGRIDASDRNVMWERGQASNASYTGSNLSLSLRYQSIQRKSRYRRGLYSEISWNGTSYESYIAQSDSGNRYEIGRSSVQRSDLKAGFFVEPIRPSRSGLSVRFDFAFNAVIAGDQKEWVVKYLDTSGGGYVAEEKTYQVITGTFRLKVSRHFQSGGIGSIAYRHVIASGLAHSHGLYFRYEHRF